jgi:hypothetical protein
MGEGGRRLNIKEVCFQVPILSTEMAARRLKYGVRRLHRAIDAPGHRDLKNEVGNHRDLQNKLPTATKTPKIAVKCPLKYRQFWGYGCTTVCQQWSLKACWGLMSLLDVKRGIVRDETAG